jgi:hypothetical protein
MRRYLLPLALVAIATIAGFTPRCSEAQQIVNIGTAPNSGNGDPARTAFTKINTNATTSWAWAPTCTLPILCSGPYSAGVTFSMANPAGISITGNAATATSLASLTLDNTLIGIAGNVPSAAPVPNCGDTTHALAYNTTTHAFSCQAINGTGGTVTGVSWNSVPSWLTPSITNPTTTPALTLGLTGGLTANQVLATPNGLTGTVGLRSLVLQDLPLIDLSTWVTGVLPGSSGGTGNGFVAFTGPTTTVKTFTLPNSNATVLTDAVVVTSAQGGTGISAYTLGDTLYSTGSATTLSRLAGNTTTTREFLSQTGTGTVSAAPAWTALATGDIPTLDINAKTTGNLGVSRGGTGTSSFTTHGVMLGENTATLGVTAAGLADTFLQGQGASADPAFSVAISTCGDSSHALSYSAVSHTFGCQAISSLSTPVSVPNGGTGVATLTAHGVLLGEGTSNVASVAAMAADTLLQGQGATADPAATTVGNCGDATHALSYSTSTHTFGCQAISAGSGVSITQVYKTTTTSRSNTTTPTADPDLQATVGTGNHTIHCVLTIFGAVSSGGFREQPAFSGTISGGAASWTYTVTRYALSTAPSTVNAMQAMSASLADPTPVANDTATVILNGSFISTTSGTVSLNWAQQTSAGGNTQLLAGSFCWFTG